MRLPTLLASAAFAALLISPATADHCESFGTSRPEVDALGLYYADVDICQVDCMHNVWIYEGSNGIPGLQRSDENVDDTCHGAIRPDTVVY